MRYRKKPIEVEAFRFYVDYMPDWFMDLMSSSEAITYNCDHRRWGMDEAYCIIDTPYRKKICVCGGEYIVKDEDGVIHTCDYETFHKTYELVGDVK